MKSLRFVAISEITGGVLLLLGGVATWKTSQVPFWHQTTSFLLAVYAVLAGTWLWTNNPMGRWISLLLQVIQLFQFATVSLLVKILVGFHLSIFIFSAGGLSVAPGLAANLGLWGPGHTQAPGIGINLLALGSIVLITICRREIRREDVPKIPFHHAS